MSERVIPSEVRAKGFSCCNMAYGYASAQERDWGVMRHLSEDMSRAGYHDIDYWRMEVEE